MNDLTQALIIRSGALSVPRGVLGMHTPRNVSMGVWGEVYGVTYWPVLGGMEDFSHAADDTADDMRHYGRHEP